MAVEWENGIPILTGESLLSDVPEYTQALAAASIMPVGAIIPYMGATAPNYWLFCNGRSYDATYFDVLSGVSANFHGDGTFRVPDLRGRSPIGENPDGNNEKWGPDSGPTSYSSSRGARIGDWRVHDHAHRVTNTNTTKSLRIGPGLRGDVVNNETENRAVINTEHAPPNRPIIYANTLTSDDGYGNWPAYPLEGQGQNLSPATVVNFIVYTGKPTLDINGDILPECGQGAEIAAVTTRMMIEARLAAKGIGEEEVKMLKEQLETLKEQDA